jgi:hypothetical protein
LIEDDLENDFAKNAPGDGFDDSNKSEAMRESMKKRKTNLKGLK